MSEAVTLPSLMMMTSTVSEETLAGDTQTDIHTHRDSASSTLNFKSKKYKKELLFLYHAQKVHIQSINYATG